MMGNVCIHVIILYQHFITWIWLSCINPCDDAIPTFYFHFITRTFLALKKKTGLSMIKRQQWQLKQATKLLHYGKKQQATTGDPPKLWAIPKRHWGKFDIPISLGSSREAMGIHWLCLSSLWKKNEHGTSMGDLHGFTYYTWRQTAMFHRKRTVCRHFVPWPDWLVPYLHVLQEARRTSDLEFLLGSSRNGGSTNGETAAGDTWSSDHPFILNTSKCMVPQKMWKLPTTPWFLRGCLKLGGREHISWYKIVVEWVLKKTWYLTCLNYAFTM